MQIIIIFSICTLSQLWFTNLLVSILCIIESQNWDTKMMKLQRIVYIINKNIVCSFSLSPDKVADGSLVQV